MSDKLMIHFLHETKGITNRSGPGYLTTVAKKGMITISKRPSQQANEEAMKEKCW